MKPQSFAHLGVNISLFAALLLASTFAAGDTLGTSFSQTVGGFAVNSQQYLADGFTLTAAVDASSVDVQLQALQNVTAPILVQLTNSLGPGAVTLAQDTFTFSSSSPFPYKQTLIVPLNLDLAAGQYYLVVSSTGTTGIIGWVPDTPLTSSLGSIDDGFYFTGGASLNSSNPAQSVWGFDNASNPLQFQLNATAVPEPTSWILLFTGVSGAVKKLLKREY